MKVAVFSCAGLGDCLLTLILSNNLAREGHEVVTFHPFMHQLQAWFPHLPIRPFPPDLEQFDRYFIIYETTPWMKQVLDECLKNRRSQTTVLNPIATPNTDYPYWEEGRFDGNLTFADNLVRFCSTILGLKNPIKSNGIVIPPDVKPRKYRDRVVIHPTSSRPGKNWPREKFLTVGQKLPDAHFIVSPEERKEWPEAPLFQSIDAMVRFVCESGYMIGNDSGIGHLASSLGVPTVSLFKNKRTANFWRPPFAPGAICLPSPWLPNIKGLRWRDQHWDWGISVRKVLSRLHSLQRRSSHG